MREAPGSIPGTSNSFLCEMNNVHLHRNWSALVNRFPGNISWIFAYGSAVFKQKDQISSSMTDLFIVVPSVLEFHKQNFIVNRSDYSIFPKITELLGQDHEFFELMHASGAQVYFNTDIKTSIGSIKYAVVEENSIINDLKNCMWIAGRLHKPIKSIYPCYGVPVFDSETIDHLVGVKAKYIVDNWKNALQMALTKIHVDKNKTIINEIEAKELLETIVNLSYSTDIRVGIAEHSNKSELIIGGEAGPWMQQIYLESSLKDMLNPDFNLCQKGKYYTSHIKSMDVLFEKYLPVLKRFRKVNRYLSLVEACKAFVSVGPYTSFKYACRKMKKRINPQ